MSLQRLIRLDRVNRRDRFSMKNLFRLSARGASIHTKHTLNGNEIETYETLQTRTWPTEPESGACIQYRQLSIAYSLLRNQNYLHNKI
jgi:hypothetical protein